MNQAKAGLHSSIDDPKELAQKIIAILDDQEKVKEMGENGRRYFLERFERKKVTREWANLDGWMNSFGIEDGWNENDWFFRMLFDLFRRYDRLRL